MTKQELTQMEKDAWEQFCQDYPMLTNDKWYHRVMRAAFAGSGLTRLMWENAWLRGMNTGVDLMRGKQ